MALVCRAVLWRKGFGWLMRQGCVIAVGLFVKARSYAVWHLARLGHHFNHTSTTDRVVCYTNMVCTPHHTLQAPAIQMGSTWPASG